MDVLKFGFKHYKRYLPIALLTQLIGFTFLFLHLIVPSLLQLLVDYVITPASTGAVSEAAAANLDKNIFSFLVSGNFGAAGSSQLLIAVVSFIFIMFFSRHVLSWTRNMLYDTYGFMFERRLRQAAFKKVLTASNTVLNRYNTGDLLTILQSDPVLYRDIFVRKIPVLLDTVFWLVAAMLFLINIHPLLALSTLVVLPVQLFLFISYIKKLRRISSAIRDASAGLSQGVQENINGVRVVRSFAAEEFEIEKFKKLSLNYKDKYYIQAKAQTLFGAGFGAIRHILYLASILIGGVFAIGGSISIGAFIAMTSYIFMVLESSTSICNILFDLQLYMVCGERVFILCSTGNVIDNPENPVRVEDKPDIVFKNVGLTIESQVILKDISIDIPYGKKLGIMGDTASGKTCIMKLLNRLQDTVSGSLYINGTDIKLIDLENLRSQFGYVMQEVFLFSNTVDANIAFANPDMPREEVIKYAEIAQADEFVSKLENGYDTVIGERGLGLSGGQKQRISIARGLAKKAPVLLLDDVTSALDTKTEKALLSALYTEYDGKTIIITAHRAESVKNCDEIIFLKNGSIAERGTHKELMDLKGYYFDIFSQQQAARTNEV